MLGADCRAELTCSLLAFSWSTHCYVPGFAFHFIGLLVENMVLLVFLPGSSTTKTTHFLPHQLYPLLNSSKLVQFDTAQDTPFSHTQTRIKTIMVRTLLRRCIKILTPCLAFQGAKVSLSLANLLLVLHELPRQDVLLLQEGSNLLELLLNLDLRTGFQVINLHFRWENTYYLLDCCSHINVLFKLRMINHELVSFSQELTDIAYNSDSGIFSLFPKLGIIALFTKLF